MKKEAIQNPEPWFIALIIIISVFQLIIKGIALWRASQSQQRIWFGALFILIPLNDLAVVELIYLFWFAKKRLTVQEIKSWFKKPKSLKKIKTTS